MTSLNILVADDDPIWRQRLAQLAESATKRFHAVSTWADLFSSIKLGDVSHVITDLSLGPDSNSGLDHLDILDEIGIAVPTLVICTHYDAAVMRRLNKLKFIRGIVPKSRILENLPTIRAFLNDIPTEIRLKEIFDFANWSTILEANRVDRDPRIVFVVHGRNATARKSVFDFLRALGLRPMEWGHAIKATGTGLPFIGDVLHDSFQRAAAVVVVLTGDDIGKVHPDYLTASDLPHERKLTPQARQNVIFEAGMALGIWPTNTLILQFGEVRPFTDIAGRHLVHYGNDREFRQQFVSRLKIVGCEVDDNGIDWLTAGMFNKIS